MTAPTTIKQGLVYPNPTHIATALMISNQGPPVSSPAVTQLSAARANLVQENAPESLNISWLPSQVRMVGRCARALLSADCGQKGLADLTL